MGLNELLAGLAVRAAHVLVVEAPGQWSIRVELEHQMLRRGWRRAWTPADADGAYPRFVDTGVVYAASASLSV